MGLSLYLRKYYRMQEKIVLVYRPTLKSAWNDRCLYLDDMYEENKPYNHRSILKNEIVLEYDEEDQVVNKKCADEAIKKIKADGLKYQSWFSGGKSTHVHFFVDPREAGNISLLKKTILRHYGTYYLEKCSGKLTACKDKIPKEEFNNFGYLNPDSKFKEIIPDLRLASETHLVRSEFGVHEKTGICKVFKKGDKDFPKVGALSKEIWEKYIKEATHAVRQKTSNFLTEVNASPELKLILDNERFRMYGDGRERCLFALIHILKPRYTNKEELQKFLVDWYKYSSNQQPDLTDQQIIGKINYHWSRNYIITVKYLREILEEIGAMGNIATEHK